MIPTNYRELAVFIASELIAALRLALILGLVSVGLAVVAIATPGPTVVYFSILMLLFTVRVIIHINQHSSNRIKEIRKFEVSEDE